MPRVDKECVTHYLSACDCFNKKIIDVCFALIKQHKKGGKIKDCKCLVCKNAKDIISTITCLTKLNKKG